MPESSAKRQKIMPENPKVIDAAKTSEGDLVIRAGAGEELVLIRVHSTFLNMASPVFRAMFGPNFLEGLTRYTADRPLRLQDDDPTAMLDLFALLHHQYSEPPPLSRFPQLVIVADKYQCMAVVKPWFVAAVTKHFPSSIDESITLLNNTGLSLENATCVAYAVGDYQLFWRITRATVVAISTKSIKSVINKGLLDLMPKTFTGKFPTMSGTNSQIIGIIQSLQINERKLVVARLEQVETDLLDAMNGEDMCNRMRYAIGEYNFCLWNYSLKRTDLDRVGTTALTKAWADIREVTEEHGLSDGEIQKVRCVKGCAACPTQKMKAKILEVVNISKRDCMGLCLECVRTEPTGRVGRKCGHKFET